MIISGILMARIMKVSRFSSEILFPISYQNCSGKIIVDLCFFFITGGNETEEPPQS